MMGENQRAKGPENLEEDSGVVNLLKRGAQTYRFKNLIKAMDLLFLEKSTLLCIWHTVTILHTVSEGLRTPTTYPHRCCKSTYYIIDPSLIQRTYMTQTQCSLLPDRTKSLSLRVPEGSRQAQKGTFDQQQHIFYRRQTQLELSLPET